MKIVQTCDEKPKPTFISGQTQSRDLQVGTVFKLIGSTNLFLRTSQGCVNLSTNNHSTLENTGTVDLIYPNARVVLE